TNVRIVSATAGSNAGQVENAFDDNETTSWKSDGQHGTGWIEFKLERPARVDEVVLKLGGFRRKAYPLRITVDGQVTYTGTTPKTLGYVTLPLKPVLGRTVRVELVGAIDDRDGFGMVEVTGKRLPDAAAAGAKGVLEVIEAEVYEAISDAALNR
ncbi:MAG TPA: discoidin domain-containing protein, partial [Verrucomicrobiae bacterium]